MRYAARKLVPAQGIRLTMDKSQLSASPCSSAPATPPRVRVAGKSLQVCTSLALAMQRVGGGARGKEKEKGRILFEQKFLKMACYTHTRARAHTHMNTHMLLSVTLCNGAGGHQCAHMHADSVPWRVDRPSRHRCLATRQGIESMGALRQK